MASSCGSATSTSPCAACKFLRRKCLPECVFAPYFPPDQPSKFANVHKVFGASNVSKLLNDLQPQQREDAVNSLAYEADMRLRDPVYGCVGVISLLQHQLRQLQIDLTCAKTELSKYQNTITISGLAAAAAAAAHHHHHFHHQFFPVNQPPHLLRSTTAPSTPPPFDNMGYDTAGALLSINAFLPSAAAGPPAEDRRTPVEPS